MRGKAIRHPCLLPCCRITPAHAGKRWSPPQWSPPRWDHPRACGEKPSRFCGGRAGTGSPPRMRGKVFPCTDLLFAVRITPAHAGKRNAAVQRMMVRKDHPRACGEKYIHNLPEYSITGSPPRMRGKVTAHIVNTLVQRITPAHAGKRL